MSAFADRLKELRDGATPERWGVYDECGTVEISLADNLGERPCIVGWPGFDSNDQSTKINQANAKLIVYLVNHAAAIEALVRQMEREHVHHPVNNCAGCAAIAALTKGE